MGLRSILIAVLVALALPGVAAANPQIIVKREAGLSASERRDIRAGADVRLVEALPLPRTELVAARPGDVRDALRDLNADPHVVYAELDRRVTAAADPELDPLWGLATIEAAAAWTHGTGAGRTVAVIDSGVDATHPDLAGRVVPGWDWVGDDAVANDANGHGTHVAGTIAAVRDSAGVVGVAHGARIMPLRVLDANGDGSVSDLIKAYEFAAERGARIVNASLGGLGAVHAEREAIRLNPDVLFVVAAGNSSGDNDDPAQAQFPCSYDLPNVLCVGASDKTDQPAAFTNVGDTTVDVFAPGVDIRSTYKGGYASFQGTSMATPHVAGMAAVLLGLTPDLSPAQAIAAIVTHSDKKAALDGLAVSDGRANLRLVLDTNDADGDAVIDRDDNCPVVANPLQQPGDCAEPADRDGDGHLNGADACPDEPAAYASDGCPSAGPDADGDAWPDAVDNCVALANPDQADADRDGIGDACDSTPRGDDPDGDGVPALDDLCHATPGPAPSGCPPVAPGDGAPEAADADGDGRPDASDGCPTEYAHTADGCPLAQVAALSAKPGKRSARVTVVTTRVATMRITAERKRGRRWVRVARRTVAGKRATLSLEHVARGAYRVRVAISSSAGSGTPVSKSFRVR